MTLMEAAEVDQAERAAESFPAPERLSTGWLTPVPLPTVFTQVTLGFRHRNPEKHTPPRTQNLPIRVLSEPRALWPH